MATKEFCDICGRELTAERWREIVRVHHDREVADYCLVCWSDKKNWQSIHTVGAKQ